MLSLLQTSHEAALEQARILQEQMRSQQPMAFGMPVQQLQAETDLASLAQKGLNLYDKGAGTNYGGYAAAAATWGKFVDTAFDKDSSLGGIGRRNVHWLEDAGRKTKDVVKKATFFKDIKEGVGDFFGKLF